MSTHTLHNQEQQENTRHSGTVGPVTQYVVCATFDNGAKMTFGLSAEDYDRAVIVAQDRVPRPPRILTVQPLLPPPGKGSATYAEHQSHAEKHDGCRFCTR